ncbi:dentin sialophosphoprotein isoform X3 [Carassius gibelio]|uniref:dentin sialophosphoprotein isoform X3 n=1 Tax=Carassius gibelio TaxID=101364 RepID=UPI002279588B|nr:dentin sialophosphoprotein isoform X3 [Carassius gibelio]
MDQNIDDFLLDAFPETNFENLNFDEDTATAHSINAPQNKPGMKEDDNLRESSGSDSDIDSEWTNREEETKHCFENNRNFSLDTQGMKAGSTLCGSWDDNEPVENMTQTQNQLLSLHEEECREKEFEIHEDIHQMSKEQAEDVSVLDMVLQEGSLYGLETMSTRTQEETTSHLLSYQMLDESENESSTSKEERMEPDSTEEHVLQNSQDDTQLKRFSAIQSTRQDWKVASAEVQFEDEMNEFTEEDQEDHERDEEGLAEYPSDLSQSDSGDSSEGQEVGQPNRTDSNLAEVQAVGIGCSYETENLEEPLDAGYHREISNIGESSDFGFSKNFRSNSSECYMNEQPDYDSDFSSDGDYSKNQEDIPELISHTVSEDKNTPLQKQEHSFTKDFATDWNSIEHEVVDGVVEDSQKPEMCCVEGLSSIPKSHGSVMKCSTETDLSENISVGESHPSESVSVKTDQNNQERNREHSEVLDIGENINTLLPGMFWSQDNLKLDEYDWDINEEEVICDEEDNFLEELEDDGEEAERDWEKEKARIEAFNRYYEPVEGEENKARSHKVTFCLEPESSQYEEDSYSSEEELRTKCCISESHPPESSSFRQDQSNGEDSREPSEDSDGRENISTFLMDEDNMKLDDYDCDINAEEEFFQMKSSKVICDDDDDFLEKLKIEIERDMGQEQARIEACNRYYGESFKEEQSEVTDGTHKVMLRFHQQPSQNDEDNDSSEQESNTEDDTASILKTEDQSDSDEADERRLYTGRYKVLPKGLQKADKKLKEYPKRNKCLVLLQSVLAGSLVTAVGVLSYWWATDTLDWIY